MLGPDALLALAFAGISDRKDSANATGWGSAWGLGFRVLGLRVQGSGFRGCGFRVQGFWV